MFREVKRTDIRTAYTVDLGGETEDWRGQVGFVPTDLNEQPDSNAAPLDPIDANVVAWER